MKHSVIGMDIAKQVFQLHTVNAATGQIERIKLHRHQVQEFFAQRPCCTVAMEACGSAHYWRRELLALGHEVKLLPPRAVRPFVQRNKTDAADAKGIWTAVQQPEVRLVAVKSETEQAVLALHRLREQLLKFRIMQTNALRGLFYEFGEVLPSGHGALLKELPRRWAALETRLPALLIESLREQYQRVQSVEQDIIQVERRLARIQRDNPAMQAVAAIPGVGLLTATAAVAAMGEPRTFHSGREFAAWLGLVPRQTGTGGRVRQLGISKRGDTYLRTLLIHAARTLVLRQQRSAWVEGLLRRRPYNVAVAAVANKLARIIWAVLATGQPYRGGAFSAAPG